MNPQQIQQVRQVAQEQLQPFQKQLSLRIDGLAKHTSNEPGLQKIIENQQIENTNLREIINQQNTELKKLTDEITTQVNKHTVTIDLNVAELLKGIKNRLEKLEGGNNIEEYYKNKIILINQQLDECRDTLTKLNIQINKYDHINDEIGDINNCLNETMPKMARDAINYKLNELTKELNRIEIDKIKEQVDISKQRIENLTRKAIKLSEFEI